MHLFEIIKNHISRSYARLSYQRKSQLYCVGAAKTGTHSIDSMFNDTIRSSHEADSAEVIEKVLDLSTDRIHEKELVSFIRERDKRLCLDVDSSQLNFFLLDYLVEEFPKALFLLTIRDCYSWLHSFINHSLHRNAGEHWIKIRDYRFRSNELSHPPEEYPLKAKGLYTLDGYLSYWASHNQKVLTSIPEDRLMIVKTNEITERAYKIAEFAGLPKNSIQLTHSHSFHNLAQHSVLQEIQEDYLQAKFEEHCGALMEQYFPEIKSVNDSNI